MHAMLRSSTRFLDRPLSLASRGVVLLGIVALVAGAFLPLWGIQLVAPQYQEGLSLQMYTHKITGGNGGQDLFEINTLNHYIGMKAIAQSDFAEMTWMPFAIGIFGLLSLRSVIMGRIGHLVDLGVLFIYFGAFSLGTFAYRLWSYGHHLNPDAPMHVAPFTPVVIGRQQIANFVQTSIPMSGTACMGLFLVSILFAIWMSRQEEM
jgi:copper chaperone NosL